MMCLTWSPLAGLLAHQHENRRILVTRSQSRLDQRQQDWIKDTQQVCSHSRHSIQASQYASRPSERPLCFNYSWSWIWPFVQIQHWRGKCHWNLSKLKKVVLTEQHLSKLWRNIELHVFYADCKYVNINTVEKYTLMSCHQAYLPEQYCLNPFTPANCSRTDITDPAHTKCVLKMNTFV